MRNYIIFSDLDGTLLDHKTYTFDPALEALSIIKSRQIPLILSSSKTRAEIERIQSHLTLKDPFIFENGSKTLSKMTIKQNLSALHWEMVKMILV